MWFFNFSTHVKFSQFSSDHLKSHRWSRNPTNTKLTVSCNLFSCYFSKMERCSVSTARRDRISQLCCMAVTFRNHGKVHFQMKEGICERTSENSVMGWHRWCQKIQDWDCCWWCHSAFTKSKCSEERNLNQCWWLSRWWLLWSQIIFQ